MNLLLKVLNRYQRYSGQFRSACYRRRFLVAESPRHKKIVLGRGVTFYVPVRGGGRGTVQIGENTNFGLRLAGRLGSGEILLQARTPEAEIIIGRDNWLNNNTSLCAVQSIRIGNFCRIGDLVSIMDTDFHEIDPVTRNRSVGVIKPVSIGNNVWIGSRVMVLKGASIGDNSVIAAMSVVTSAIPPNCIAAGIPAKVIRQIEQHR